MSTHPEVAPYEDIIDVRCIGGLHFRVVDGATIEVKCKHCGDKDSVVLHRYSLPDFKLQKTLRLKELRGRGARSPRKENL